MIVFKKCIFTMALLCVVCSVFGQKRFWKNISAELSYDRVNTWSVFPISRNYNNDGRGIGIGLNYSLNKALFLELEYSVNRVEHLDLDRIFFDSNYSLGVGYNFKIDALNELRPRLSLAVITLAQYTTITTEIVGRPESRNKVHYYSGKEPFRHWSIGFDYRHNVCDRLYIGLSCDINYAFTFDFGRTNLSLLIGWGF